MKVAVYGTGSWGTAMTVQLASKHQNIWMYARNEAFAIQLNKERENKKYLPGVILPNHVKISHDLPSVIKEADVVIIATPSQGVVEAAQAIKPYIHKNVNIVLTAKGLEAGTGRRLSESVRDCIGDVTENICVLSGPNHAEEVGVGQPSATVIAGEKEEAVLKVQELYMLPNFRAYRNEDMIGVEYAGALKNIIALCTGIITGLGYGDNTKAALITRGLAEIKRFGMYFGAKGETFMGLAGMGDLIATCMSPHSRNRSAGIALSKGKSIKEIQASTSMVIEGVRVTDIVYHIAKEKRIPMPITEKLYDVLYNGVSPVQAIAELMEREKQVETR